MSELPKDFDALDPAAQMALLQKRKAERDAARANAKAAAAVKLALLIDEQEDAGGVRGVDYDIVETVDAPIVLVRGDGLLHEVYTKYQAKASKGEELAVKPMLDFVIPQVHSPDEKTARAIFDKFHGALLAATVALNAMHSGKVSAEEGKA